MKIPKDRLIRRIVSAVYNDCERICVERMREEEQSPFFDGLEMAKLLKNLMIVRRKQILRYNVDLPMARGVARFKGRV